MTMTQSNDRVDAYIADAAKFAQPILQTLRKTIHDASAGLTETIKWGMPYFERKGLVCGIAAFQSHCSLVFPKADRIWGKDGGTAADEGMGQFGKLRSTSDLPPRKALIKYVHIAVALNEAGFSAGSAPRGTQTRRSTAPSDLIRSLRNHADALGNWSAFSPSQQREYIAWIAEAKSLDTREKRLLQAVEWIADGKSRYWKYAKR